MPLLTFHDIRWLLLELLYYNARCAKSPRGKAERLCSEPSCSTPLVSSCGKDGCSKHRRHRQRRQRQKGWLFLSNVLTQRTTPLLLIGGSEEEGTDKSKQWRAEVRSNSELSNHERRSVSSSKKGYCCRLVQAAFAILKGDLYVEADVTNVPEVVESLWVIVCAKIFTRHRIYDSVSWANEHRFSQTQL